MHARPVPSRVPSSKNLLFAEKINLANRCLRILGPSRMHFLLGALSNLMTPLSGSSDLKGELKHLGVVPVAQQDYTHLRLSPEILRRVLACRGLPFSLPPTVTLTLPNPTPFLAKSCTKPLNSVSSHVFLYVDFWKRGPGNRQAGFVLCERAVLITRGGGPCRPHQHLEVNYWVAIAIRVDLLGLCSKDHVATSSSHEGPSGKKFGLCGPGLGSSALPQTQESSSE